MPKVLTEFLLGVPSVREPTPMFVGGTVGHGRGFYIKMHKAKLAQ